MTIDEARQVWALVKSGSAQQDLDDDRVKLMLSHLAPLPYRYARTNAETWIATANLDGKPKWCSSPDDLLEACGVSANSRGLVTKALREGGAVMRDTATGWSYVADPSRAIPAGVALALQEAGEALPEGICVKPWDVFEHATPSTPRDVGMKRLGDFAMSRSGRMTALAAPVVAMETVPLAIAKAELDKRLRDIDRLEQLALEKIREADGMQAAARELFAIQQEDYAAGEPVDPMSSAEAAMVRLLAQNPTGWLDVLLHVVPEFAEYQDASCREERGELRLTFRKRTEATATRRAS